MASVTRQPFAPLDGARLQTLTSIKNRQNALSPTSGKRKASLIEDTDDFENIDPSKSSKRSKPSKGLGGFPIKEARKPSFKLTTKAANPASPLNPAVSAPVSAPASTRASARVSAPAPTRAVANSRRSLLGPKSPSRFPSGITKSSPLSPARSKRVSLLASKKRAATSPYSRIDPPVLSALSAPATPFSLDAALKGSIPSYAARSNTAALSAGKPRATDLGTANAESPMKEDWFFDIHEDSHEQEMTNLLQHSTCILEISSDEETETKMRREQDEGGDKENVPPSDDISQRLQRRRAATAPEFHIAMDETAMIMEQKIEARVALREMNTRDYFAAGCDDSSVFVVPADDDAETVVDETENLQPEDQERQTNDFVLAPAPEIEVAPEIHTDSSAEQVLPHAPSVDELMRQVPEAEIPVELPIETPIKMPLEIPVEVYADETVSQPLNETQGSESFELWESGSANDENEAPAVLAEL